MTCYIVIAIMWYEFSDVVGVYATLDEARAKAKEIREARKMLDQIDIDHWEGDKLVSHEQYWGRGT